MIICVHHVDVVFVCVVECGGQFRGRGTRVSPPNLCRIIIGNTSNKNMDSFFIHTKLTMRTQHFQLVSQDIQISILERKVVIIIERRRREPQT